MCAMVYTVRAIYVGLHESAQCWPLVTRSIFVPHSCLLFSSLLLKESSSLVLFLSFCHSTDSWLKMENSRDPLEPPSCFLHHPSDIHHPSYWTYTLHTSHAKMAFQTGLNVLTTMVKTLLSLILEPSQSLAFYCKSQEDYETIGSLLHLGNHL